MANPKAYKGTRPKRKNNNLDAVADLGAQLIARGYTLQEVADALGVCSKSHLSYVLATRGKPTKQQRPTPRIGWDGTAYVLLNRKEINAALAAYDGEAR